MNKIITISDSSYFKYGSPLLMTKKLVNGEYIIYTSGLNRKQEKILNKNNFTIKYVNKEDFDNKMQFLKFDFIKNNIDNNKECKGVTLVDFDTFFVKDWSSVYNDDFDIGLTVRNGRIKRKTLRAINNGGVIFTKNTDGGRSICEFALETMKAGGHKLLPEYDEVFKTFEPGSGYPEDRAWSRTNLRWWVDQVFMSALACHHLKKTKFKTIKDKEFFDFHGYKIGLFNCDIYNRLDPNPRDIPDIYNKKEAYIMHMKSKGRDEVSKLKLAIDKAIK